MKKIDQSPKPSTVEHSLEMAWAAMLAGHLTLNRNRTEIQTEDYFGAVYLASRDSLAAFWKDGSVLDAFAQTACDLSEPPWFYWIEFYHALKKKKYREGMMIPCSKELAAILRDATDLANNASRTAKAKPELKVQHFLAAMTAHKQMRFTRLLTTSGLDFRKLRPIK